MTIAVRPESRAEIRAAWDAVLDAEHLLPAMKASERESGLPLSTAELAFRIFATFRAHPHINNVLTHISSAKLVKVEKSLNRILDLSTTVDSLSPLEKNIIELMVGERGITGKILKPYFKAVLEGAAPATCTAPERSCPACLIISPRIARCRLSLTTILDGFAFSLKRVTARAATGHIWRKAPMSGAFACACSAP